MDQFWKVLHMSDTHWDPYYLEGTNANCELPLCCRPCYRLSLISKVKHLFFEFNQFESGVQMFLYSPPPFKNYIWLGHFLPFPCYSSFFIPPPSSFQLTCISEDLELGSEVKWVPLTSASTDAATPSTVQVLQGTFGNFTRPCRMELMLEHDQEHERTSSPPRGRGRVLGGLQGDPAAIFTNTPQCQEVTLII